MSTRVTTKVSRPAATSSPKHSDSSTGGKELLVAIAVLVLALVGLLLYLVRRGRAATSSTAASWDLRLDRATGTARWLADRLAVDVVDRSGTRNQTVRSWDEGRETVIDLERSLNELDTSAPDQPRSAAARRLVEGVLALRNDLEADMRLRDSDESPERQAMLDESAEAVARSRSRLDRLIEGVPPTTTPGVDPS